MNRARRIVVAMSGGVDSSVAAALLKKEGHEVIGMTMCFNLEPAHRKKPSCCGSQGIDDARHLAHKLGIPHYVVSMREALQAHVIDDFCREYMRGRTPNPCVWCNRFVKFDALLKKAKSLNAGFLATGHYARVEKHRGYLLKKGRDLSKDQSYFLYRLGQRQLAHALFPLGGLTKQKVRSIARSLDMAVADKEGSQEICFLPQDDYRLFLKQHAACCENPGEVVDTRGRALGVHKGIAFYTVGQRRGLRIATGYPLYVIRIERARNRIVVGRYKDACRRQFWVKGAHFINGMSKKRIEATVKIRYNHSGARADIVCERRLLRITFRKPQFAITPGQSAVFYQRRTVLGGGIIEEVA